MSFNSLPPEIILMILRPCHFTGQPLVESKKEYIKLRLVSRTFSVYITPHIFQNITIRSTECSLKRLETIAESERTRAWVKQYTYDLTLNARIPTPPRGGIHDEYLRLSADPSGLDELEKMRSSTDPTIISIARWLKQREFELSNDLHELHVKSLSMLPILKSIRLMSPSRCGLSELTPNIRFAANISGSSWGPVVFRAVLSAMYNRTQTENTTPIENFEVEGVTEECMLLPPALVRKAISAFQNIKHLKICIQSTRNTQGSSTAGWIVLIGRLIQSVDSLESLEIEVLENHSNIHFSTLVSPYKSKLLDKPDIAPTAPRWPSLRKLILRDAIFTESHILQFLSSHRKSLRWIQFHNCELKQTYELTENNDDTNFPDVTANPWLVVLRQIHKYFAPNSSSSLNLFEIDELYYDSIRLKRMHKRETELWQSYITGTITTEPAPCDKGLCKDCLSEGDSLGDISIDENDGYFFGGVGSFLDTDDDDLGDIEEDLGDDGDFFVGMPPMHVYGWHEMY